MPRPDLLLPSIVLVPFAAAALALLLGRRAGGRTGILMVLAAGASFGQALALAVAGWGGAPPVTVTQPWIPSLGVGVALQGDPFGLFFALLVSGIGLLVGVYALAYMPDVGPSRLAQFYAALLAFMGSMLGIALADDLILLFVFWELTSITSFILIGFWYDQDEARHGALTALLVTALGGLAMLTGFLILGLSSGTFSLARLTASPDAVAGLAASGLLTPTLVLILIGALSKSAQWPFHFWLPGAMVAPTPVSTYLHAATMVKAGVFLLGRLLPLFGEVPAWSAVLVPVGLFTFLLGAFQALREHDLKAILARTTLSALGLFTMLYGLRLPGQDALQILSHAAYKGPLFLVAGIVEHATHTRDLRRLGGLRRAMPLTFAVCLVAALSMAGLPPFLGFLAKEALYEELLHLGGQGAASCSASPCWRTRCSSRRSSGWRGASSWARRRRPWSMPTRRVRGCSCPPPSWPAWRRCSASARRWRSAWHAASRPRRDIPCTSRSCRRTRARSSSRWPPSPWAS
jgi:NADH:ubiquinone oxidoreductase subunit 5 (subunit L)/multisubunit Na+/H+ antiporter MnhA subunit